MATRPLMQNGIGALEAMFAESPADAKVLRSLQDELKHRQVPRAIALLQKVAKALKSGSVPDADVKLETMPPTLTQLTEIKKRHRSLAVDKQPALWAENDNGAPRVTATSASAVPAKLAPSARAPVGSEHVLMSSPAEKPPLKTETPSMSVSEAYHRLQAAPGTSWETIEETRQRVVQQSHPENLAKVSEKKRVELVIEAKRANLAYEVIRKERIPNFL
jgi:hypothetical protein